MKQRTQLLLAVLVALAVGLILRSLAGPEPVRAQTPAIQSGIGRYNISTGGDGTYYIDTKTGRVWEYTGVPANSPAHTTGWHEIPSPLAGSR